MSQRTPVTRFSTSMMIACCAASITRLRLSEAGRSLPTCVKNTGRSTGSRRRPDGGCCRFSSDTTRCPDRHWLNWRCIKSGRFRLFLFTFWTSDPSPPGDNSTTRTHYVLQTWLLYLHLTRGKFFIDTQDHFFYTPTVKKQYVINYAKTHHSKKTLSKVPRPVTPPRQESRTPLNVRVPLPREWQKATKVDF
jgi:hypothetical protein